MATKRAAAPLAAATSAKAVTALRQRKIRTVHIGIFDNDACFRARRLPTAVAESAFRGEYSFVNVLPQWDIGENILDPEFDFVDEPVTVDPTSGRHYPFEPDAALYVGSYAGPSAALSPRSLLADQVTRAAKLGFDVKAALECEFTVLAETAESLRSKGFASLSPALPDNRCWAADTAAPYAQFCADLEAMLNGMAIPIYALGTELGPGCLEATLMAEDAVRAADSYALFRQMTKAFCRQRGMTATFMALVGDGFQGLSGHVHLSLSDRKTGKPVFADARAKDGISPTMRRFIAGILHQLPDWTALCTQTVNAYRRMVPGMWAPRTATWGFNNYSVAVRVAAATPETTRIEFRIPASDTNPFLAIATALAAGLWGIENDPPLPAPVTGNARETVPKGLKPLPHDLKVATDRLVASKTARAMFGDRFIDHFAKTRYQEEAALRREVSAAERRRYLETL
jgi:glutamine synthetase